MLGVEIVDLGRLWKEYWKEMQLQCEGKVEQVQRQLEELYKGHTGLKEQVQAVQREIAWD